MVLFYHECNVVLTAYLLKLVESTVTTTTVKGTGASLPPGAYRMSFENIRMPHGYQNPEG